MRLTRSVSYSVSVLLRVASQPAGSPMTAANISKGCKFPPRFLYRVLRRLVSAGLLTAVSGPRGGYALARPAGRIRLSEIVAAVEGNDPPAELSPVTPQHRRAIQAINATIRRQHDRFAKELAKTSLLQLLQLQQR